MNENKIMCTRPLHFFRSNIPDENGKYPGFITGYQRDLVGFKDFAKHNIKCTSTYLCSPIKVPCGKCPECRKALKRQWVARTVAEMETSPFSYFLTLTYDNEHLTDCNKKDIQEFLNRFRYKNKTRYLVVGELGDKTNRPHYHAIIFPEKPIDDLERINNSKVLPYYKSNKVASQWQKGNVMITEASPSTIAYTVGYMVSKKKKTTFKMQSQGLGYKFFEDLKKTYILSDNRGHEMIVGLPRYLKKKYGLDFELNDFLLNLRWSNEVKTSGLDEESYRTHKEFIEEAGFNH